jgi:hypothetical protein
MPNFVEYDYRMIRTSQTPKETTDWNWSHTATFVLLAFLAIGAIELGGRHVAGAVICFVLAAAYVPLRVVRGRWLGAREGR